MKIGNLLGLLKNKLKKDSNKESLASLIEGEDILRMMGAKNPEELIRNLPDGGFVVPKAVYDETRHHVIYGYVEYTRNTNDGYDSALEKGEFIVTGRLNLNLVEKCPLRKKCSGY